MSTALKIFTVAPRTKHTATVIFMHGLGDHGDSWKPVASMLQRDPGLGHIKWVLPDAPVQKVTANMGMQMPSWFDIFDFDGGKEDEPGMLKTMHNINQIISAEVDAGIPPSRIVLGGFSQGAAMSLLTGLTNERKLGGVVVLSGWLPIPKTFKMMVSEHAKKVPIFWGHGTADPLIKFKYSTDSIHFLKNGVGIADASPDDLRAGGLSFHAYEGLTHSASDQELHDLGDWLKAVEPIQE